MSGSRSGSGHEERFPPPRLSGRYRFSQATFAGAHGNGRDAPIPVIREAAIEPPGPKKRRAPKPKPAKLVRSMRPHQQGALQ